MNSRVLITSALVAALALGATPAGAQQAERPAPAERPATAERPPQAERAERPQAERAERPQVERTQAERPQVERRNVERPETVGRRPDGVQSKPNPPAGSLLPVNPADLQRAAQEQKRDECLRQQDEAFKNQSSRSLFSRFRGHPAPCQAII
jgi:hypothetical protein